MSFFQDEHPKLQKNFKNLPYHYSTNDYTNCYLFTRKFYDQAVLKAEWRTFNFTIMEKISKFEILPLSYLFCLYMKFYYGSMDMILVCLICGRGNCIPSDSPDCSEERLIRCIKDHIYSDHDDCVYGDKYPRNDLLREIIQLDDNFAIKELDTGDHKYYFIKYNSYVCHFCGETYAVPPATEVIIAHLGKCPDLCRMTVPFKSWKIE